MKFTELLKSKGFTSEQIATITQAMSTEKIYTTKEENIEQRYNKLKGQKEDLEQQITTATQTINDLKKGNADNTELQTKVKEYETQLETLKTESSTKIKNITIDNAISKILSENKAKYSDLLSSKFDREKIEIKEDGSITGLEEQFKTIKEGYKDMFQQSLGGRVPNLSNGTGATKITKEQFNGMGYKDRVALNKENPDLYKELKGEM